MNPEKSLLIPDGRRWILPSAPVSLVSWVTLRVMDRSRPVTVREVSCWMKWNCPFEALFRVVGVTLKGTSGDLKCLQGDLSKRMVFYNGKIFGYPEGMCSLDYH